MRRLYISFDCNMHIFDVLSRGTCKTRHGNDVGRSQTVWAHRFLESYLLRSAIFGAWQQAIYLHPWALKKSLFWISLYSTKYISLADSNSPVSEVDPPSMPIPRTSGAPSLSWRRAPVFAGLRIRLSSAH